jgi:hypothetical protein
MSPAGFIHCKNRDDLAFVSANFRAAQTLLQGSWQLLTEHL